MYLYVSRVIGINVTKSENHVFISPETILLQRYLSQPQQSCENLDTRGTPKGGNEEINKEEKETSS